MAVSLVELQRWQQRAVRVLGDLLAQGVRRQLPVIAWTVTHAGASLVGRSLAIDPAERRAAWASWTEAVAAVPWPERTDAGGWVHLHAVAKHYDGLIDIAVVADVDTNPPDDQEPAS